MCVSAFGLTAHSNKGATVAEQKAPESAAAPAAAPASSVGKPILFIALAIINMLVVAGVGSMI